jgi:mycothiol synthase
MKFFGPTEPRIASYRDTEAVEVARFLTECAARDETLGQEAQSIDDWRAFTAQSYNRDARDFCVVRKRSRIVAILTSTLLPGTKYPRRHFRIIVHPNERRQGIGTLLIKRVEMQEPKRGVVLQCNCRESWTAGREFLGKSGFEVVRKQWKMELSLGSSLPFTLPPEYQIRQHRGTATDDQEWLRLDHEGYSDDEDAQRPTADDLAVRRRLRGFRFWLLEHRGAVVGFLHATATRRAHIHSLVVVRDYRGQGLGRVLMVHAMNALRRNGAVGFTLYVRADNAPAVRLYRDLGFEVVEEMETWQRAIP